MRHLQATLLFFALATGPNACTYDFDSLESAAEGMVDMDTVDGMVPDAGADADPDAAPDADLSADLGPDMPAAGALGAACMADADCVGFDTCFEGYCTTACDAMAEESVCPTGSTCVETSPTGPSVCLLECPSEEGASCMVEGRQDLRCVTGVSGRRGRAQDFAARTYRACLPDADGDGVPLHEDNCPDEGNPLQRDRDLDAVGDVCDDAPLCHPSQMMGRVDYGTVTYPATDYSVPDILTTDWFLAAGGVDDAGFSVAARARLDRLTASFETIEDNLYPGVDFAAVGLDAQTYLTMPGRAEGEARQTGRLLEVSRDGSVTQLRGLNIEVFEPVFATTANAEILVLGYRSQAGVSNNYSVWRYDASSEAFVRIYNGSQLQDRPEWHATRRRDGGVRYYTEGTPLMMDNSRQSLLVEFDVLGRQDRVDIIELPNDADGNDVSPFLFETSGGLEFLFNRDTGTAYTLSDFMGRVVATSAEAFDISVEVTDPEYITLGDGGAGFIVVGRDADDTTLLRATEYNLSCLPGAGANDADRDGIPDIEDTCPTSANAAQRDADRDGLGDVCDEDEDNDGLIGSVDTRTDDMMMEVSLRLDSDNDGIDNIDDDDDDSDGIPDTEDRFWLDTDNDGVPNLYDDDDDNDDASDPSERANGTDPFNPLDFPAAGQLVWVRSGDGGARTVEWARLAEMSMQTQVTLPMDVTPYSPRWDESGESVLVLDGEPGVATAVGWSRALVGDEEAMDAGAQRFQFDTTLRGAVPVTKRNMPDGPVTPAEVIAARRAGMMPERWELARIELIMDPMTMMFPTTSLVTRLQEVEGPYVSSNTVYFLGAPRTCDACLSVYNDVLSRPTGGSLIFDQFLGATSVTSNGGRIMVVAPDEEGVQRAYLNGTELMPPGADEVDSAVPLSTGTRAVISARSADGSYDLWFFNGKSGLWYKLKDSEEDFIEIDWKN